MSTTDIALLELAAIRERIYALLWAVRYDKVQGYYEALGRTCSIFPFAERIAAMRAIEAELKGRAA